MDESQKQQLIEKSKELLSQSRYLSANEIFMVESALNNNDISDEDLKTIHDSLVEYKNEQDSAYSDFKKEVSEAIQEYVQSTTSQNS